MSHFVYIIFSQNLNIYYKGYSSDPFKRVADHNKNKSTYTKNKGPWILVYLECFETKLEALYREKQLKRQNHRYLEWLIKQETNLVNKL